MRREDRLKHVARAFLFVLVAWLLATELSQCKRHPTGPRPRMYFDLLDVDGEIRALESIDPLPTDLQEHMIGRGCIFRSRPRRTGLFATRTSGFGDSVHAELFDSMSDTTAAIEAICVRASQIRQYFPETDWDFDRLAKERIVGLRTHFPRGYLIDGAVFFGSFAVLAIGLCLFDRWRRITRLIASGRICSNCRYDLSGLAPQICPECGYHAGLPTCLTQSAPPKQ